MKIGTITALPRHRPTTSGLAERRRSKWLLELLAQ
jgi:hypothetical protein